MMLDEAVGRLKELGEQADMATALWLVRRLDFAEEATLRQPVRRCATDCQVASYAARRDAASCVCFQTTLALRLMERAFGPCQATPARLVTRHRHECPACGISFVSKRKSAVYCAVCEGTAKAKGKVAA